jgi:RNA polymerase sigma-70 factor (ECF subfamily)
MARRRAGLIRETDGGEPGPVEPLVDARDGGGATARAGPSGWERDTCARLAARDEAALTEIYDQYASFVFGLALRVIREQRGAEDVAQEVFVFLWERPDAFDPERGSLRTWLGTLTHRRAVDYVRREEARRKRAQRDAACRATQLPDVEELATALVTAERVRAALAELPDEQREAIHLAYFGGRTYRQVAAELGIPEGTAKSRLRLGMRRVAAALADDVEEPA